MENFEKDNFTKDMHAGEYPNEPLKYLAASSIIGDKVYDKAGTHMGHIKDVMLDVNAGKIHYLVVEFGGFLGMGAKYFAIPYGHFQVDPANKRFIYTESKEELKNAPGFNHWHWPDTNFHLVEEHWDFV